MVLGSWSTCNTKAHIVAEVVAVVVAVVVVFVVDFHPYAPGTNTEPISRQS